ncbi:MAG: TetR/AcrR family transcriptional regulator [Rhodospirillales bacterium]|nr:TetR/AcrR family transcriptional regulator [Rhodospirillales bacterium]
MEGRILDVATGLFFCQGFAATSMEQVAAVARISKRTLYARFHDKAALFRGVVDRRVSGWRGSFEAEAEQPETLPAALKEAASGILRVALEPAALALHRMVVAEAERFPELARTLAAKSAAGVEWLAALLGSFPEGARLSPEDRAFAAEQFLMLVVSGPRRRALGLGRPLDATGLALWAERSVALFLGGLGG